MSFVNLAGLGDTYTVKAGDTLNAIGARFGMTAQEIADLNDIEDIDSIDVGQVLNLPYGVVTASQIESQIPVASTSVAQQVANAIAPAATTPKAATPAPAATIPGTMQNIVKTLTPTALTTQPAVAATAGKRAMAVAQSSGITMSTVLIGGAALALTTALILIIKKRREE